MQVGKTCKFEIAAIIDIVPVLTLSGGMSLYPTDSHKINLSFEKLTISEIFTNLVSVKV